MKMTYEAAFATVKKNFVKRLAENALNSLRSHYDASADAYLQIIISFCDNELSGAHDTWASDSFAFAFNETPGFPREWYERMYREIFE